MNAESEKLDEFENVNKPLRMLRPIPVYLLAVGEPGQDVNIMAASWVTPASKVPPRVLVVVDRANYTHNLLTRYPCFSLNIVSIDDRALVKYVGTHSRREVDKIQKTGIKLAFLSLDKLGCTAPIYPMSLGFLIVKTRTRFDMSNASIFVGDIVRAQARRAYFTDKSGWDTSKAKILLHKSKHVFLECSCNEWPTVQTPWGIAMKKPWRSNGLSESR